MRASKNQHTINAIALLRNPKNVLESLASPEYSQWIAAIQTEMSSRIDEHAFDVCPIPHGVPHPSRQEGDSHQAGAQDKNRQREAALTNLKHAAACSASVKPKVSIVTRITCTPQ
jgi:hypothetical protein